MVSSTDFYDDKNIFIVEVLIYGMSVLAKNVDWKFLQYLFHYHFFILLLFLQWHENNTSGTSSLSGALISGNFPTLSVTKICQMRMLELKSTRVY
jgi:hypothetical protein